MAKFRTYKMIAKRVRVTRTGKMLHKRAGQDHFNAREPGKITRNKRRPARMATVNQRNIFRALGN